jgi:hypothetical protein
MSTSHLDLRVVPPDLDGDPLSRGQRPSRRTRLRLRSIRILNASNIKGLTYVSRVDTLLSTPSPRLRSRLPGGDAGSARRAHGGRRPLDTCRSSAHIAPVGAAGRQGWRA